MTTTTTATKKSRRGNSFNQQRQWCTREELDMATIGRRHCSYEVDTQYNGRTHALLYNIIMELLLELLRKEENYRLISTGLGRARRFPATL